MQRAQQTVDLVARRGETIALVGENEQENTRWLQTLAGMNAPSAGTLLLCGETPSREKRMPARTGYLSAGAPLLSTFDVITNVMLPRLYHLDETPETARGHALELLRRTGFEGGNTLPAWLDRLSSFRVMLARALATDPALLFVHEPFDIALAPHWREMERVLMAVAANRALVISTQNLSFVRRHAQRILFIAEDTRTYEGWEAFRSGGPQVDAFLSAMPAFAGETA